MSIKVLVNAAVELSLSVNVSFNEYVRGKFHD